MSRRAAVVAAAVAAAVVVATIGWNAWSAGRDGWAPEGDSAVITVRTHDVLSLDPPLLGNPTTAGLASGEDLHHPGPAEFAALAVPLRLLDDHAQGMLLGAALVNAAAVATICWLALRNGGPALATWLLSATAVLVLALGDEIPHDVYNPHILLLPYALLLVTAWATACGDRAALPVGVVAASFVAQSHGYYAIPAGIAALAIGGLALTVARPSRRVVATSAALAVVAWLPPVLAELGSGPSNLAGLVRYAGAGERELSGFGFAFGRLADVVLAGGWLHRDPRLFDLLATGSAALQALTIAALGLLGFLGWRAGRAGRRATAALAGTALLAALSSVVTAARLPAGTPVLEPYSHRHWWITGALVWAAAAWVLADLVRDRARRLPAPVRQGLLGLPVLLVAVASSTPSIAADRGSVSFGAVRALGSTVAAALPSDGPWHLEARGAQASLSVEPGLVAELVVRGFEVRVAPTAGPAFGFSRVSVDGAVGTEGTILVVSAAAAPPVPEGYRLVARFDSVADAAERGHRNSVLFGGPEQLAVFVSD